MSNVIDTVCFDLDDTLCRYSQRGSEVLEAAFSDVGIQPAFSIDAYYDQYREYLGDSDDIKDLRRQCFADLATAAGYDTELGRAVADAFSSRRDQCGIDFCAGATGILESFGEQYRLGLITNGAPEMQRAKLDTLGLEGTFDTVVYAGYDTPAKPSPKPFEVALDALESQPGNAVYIGNSLESDVAGARAAGLRSVWVPADGSGTDLPSSSPSPDYVLESLEALRSPPWNEPAPGESRPDGDLEASLNCGE